MQNKTSMNISRRKFAYACTAAVCSYMTGKPNLFSEIRQRVGDKLASLSKYCEAAPRIGLPLHIDALSARVASHRKISRHVSQLVQPASLVAIGTGLGFLEANHRDPIDHMIREIRGNDGLQEVCNLAAIKQGIESFCWSGGSLSAAQWPIVVYVTRWQYSAMFLLRHEYRIKENHRYLKGDQRILAPSQFGTNKLGRFERSPESSAVPFDPLQWTFADNKGYKIEGGSFPILRTDLAPFTDSNL